MIRPLAFLRHTPFLRRKDRISFKHLDPIAPVLAFFLLVCLFGLPLLSFAPNRIIPGTPLFAVSYLDLPCIAALFAVWFAFFITSLFKKSLFSYLLCLSLLFLTLLYYLDFIADAHLLSNGTGEGQTSLASGFWGALIFFFILVLYKKEIISSNPIKTLIIGILFCISLILSIRGYILHDISLVQEYMNNKEIFSRETGRHITLTVATMIPATVIGILLGLLCHRFKALPPLILGGLNIIQTIPSIALFGLLLVPFSILIQVFPTLTYVGISGIGWAPAVVALLLYSLLPIARNTYVSFKMLDPELLQTAQGLGMSKQQVFFNVKLPFIAPFILTGLRNASVLIVGLTTIAALIGAGGYGQFIFQGLGQSSTDLILLGALPTLLLALIIDLFFALLLKFLQPLSSNTQN